VIPVQILTATSTVFSCPTRLISDVQLLRAITAAINTNPLLLVAFEAVMWAPSGDQLDPMINAVSKDQSDIPESSKKGAPRGILKRFSNLSLQLPVHRAPDFDTAVIRLCCQKLPNGVPTNALDKPVMLVNFTYSFFKGKIGHSNRTRDQLVILWNSPRVKPLQINTWESRPTEAK
jgi:hypothetical protein